MNNNTIYKIILGVKTEQPIVISSFQFTFTFAYFLRKLLTDRQRYTVNKIKKTATTTTTTLGQKSPRQQMIDHIMCLRIKFKTEVGLFGPNPPPAPPRLP